MNKIHDNITLSDDLKKKIHSKNRYNMYNKRWYLIIIINGAYIFDFIKCNDYIK